MDCKHYDMEEINLVLNGITPPTVRCKDCGMYLTNITECLSLGPSFTKKIGEFEMNGVRFAVEIW